MSDLDEAVPIQPVDPVEEAKAAAHVADPVHVTAAAEISTENPARKPAENGEVDRFVHVPPPAAPDRQDGTYGLGEARVDRVMAMHEIAESRGLPTDAAAALAAAAAGSLAAAPLAAAPPADSPENDADIPPVAPVTASRKIDPHR